jgi:hypothetical protein
MHLKLKENLWNESKYRSFGAAKIHGLCIASYHRELLVRIYLALLLDLEP